MNGLVDGGDRLTLAEDRQILKNQPIINQCNYVIYEIISSNK